MNLSKVGDRIRIPDIPLWNQSEWLKSFIGQTSTVAQLMGDGRIRVDPPIFGYPYYREDTIELAGPRDFSQCDEGGVV